MKRIAFDCETDGLLPELSVLHSLCLKDIDTGETWSCTDNDPRYPSIKEGLKILEEADVIIGHNIIKFDIPAIKKVYPEWTYKACLDTLVLTRLIYADIKDSDFKRARKGTLPKKLIGSHSLAAWGYRLGNYKGDYDGGWSTWSIDMQDYCEQDTNVTVQLFQRIEDKNYPEEAIRLEHEFCHIIARQERFGFHFDVDAAHELYSTLKQLALDLEAELKASIPSWEIRTPFTPKVNNKTRGYVKGVKTYKVKVVDFNPRSRDHIAFVLQKKYKWKPKDYTESGKPKVDEAVLSKLKYPEAKLLAELFLINKRLGQLAEGRQGWIKVQKKGRIYGSVNTNGAVTGRCTHSHPNVAQVPSLDARFGKECRTLFNVPKGKRLVGADASGLELRCLAHYMARWDGGAYAKEVLEGDIHSTNQVAAGLPTRGNAKTFIYAFLYGAGSAKIGSIVGGTPKDGTKLRNRFLRKTPALKSLLETVKAKANKQGYLTGLDGRKLHIRSDHAALNTLLQSAGALVMKQSLIFLDQYLQDAGFIPGVNYEFVANVHDEFQIEAEEDIAEQIGKLAVKAIQDAGDYFKFRCPLDGDYMVGMSWAETH